MNLFCLDGIPEIHADPSEVPGMYIALGRVDDYINQLDSEEADLVKDSSLPRQHAFSTGRFLAKTALNHLGISLTPILRNKRRPVWPEFVVGSIAHTKLLGVSAVANSSQYRGIGIDIELINAVNEKVANRIFDEEELGWIDQQPLPQWRTAMFSAKEAIYKATNPIMNEFLGFRDVTLEVDENALSFTATTTHQAAADLLKNGRGYFHRVEGHWLTTFVIDV